MRGALPPFSHKSSCCVCRHVYWALCGLRKFKNPSQDAEANTDRVEKFSFDVLTSNISFIRVPKTEKCDVTASNGTLQSANSRQGHMT
jgi:hypothetical protein